MIYIFLLRKRMLIRATRLTQKLLTSTETILLGDDEEAVIDTGEKILEAMGYKVFTASEGEEAMELSKKTRGKLTWSSWT